MLFKTPPLDPWCVVSGQSDYMVWTVDEKHHKTDYTDRKCISISKVFAAKNFLRIDENFALKFREAHSMFTSQTVVRVKNCQVVWIEEKPEYDEIFKQAKVMKDRTKPGDVKQTITKNKRKTCMIFPEEGFKPLNCEGKEFKARKSLKDFIKMPRINEDNTSKTIKSNVEFIGKRHINTLERSFSLKTNSENFQCQNDLKNEGELGQKSKIFSYFSRLSLPRKFSFSRRSISKLVNQPSTISNDSNNESIDNSQTLLHNIKKSVTQDDD